MPPPTRDQVTPTLVETLEGLTTDAGSIPAASTYNEGSEMAGKGSGNYYEPMPLDYELLRRMPDEGSMLGYHTIALTVGHVKDTLNKDAPEGARLTTGHIAARIRSMHVAGLCVKVRVMGASSAHGWQRTPKGAKFLRDNDKDFESVPLSLVQKEAHA